MSRRSATRRAAALAALVAAVALAGCSSAGPAPGRSGGSSVAGPSSTAATTSSAPAPTFAPPTVATSSTVAPSATATTAPPVPSSAPSTSAGPRSTCASLTIRVIRGSAAQGVEFAALQFVNTGTFRCVLNGYPTASLLRGGSAVGSVSAPASTATSRFVLEPGATAESLLRDFSTCQAPLSDQIRVVAPGSSITAVRPAQLRACSLRVAALRTPE